MINAVFERDNYRLTVKGHANSGESGHDLVCAAVSILTDTLVLNIKRLKKQVTMFAEAIVTRGGLDVKAFNPSTMECRSVKGLYAAGEVLDVDAHTGGFNLQIAWSTGHLAGECAAEADIK